MLGAITGDIAGSRFEFDNIKSKDFEFLCDDCYFTDDTVMTVAVGKALMNAGADAVCNPQKYSARIAKEFEVQMRDFGGRYPYAGYGGMFSRWLKTDVPKPYNSFGNGAAMRVSPCGIAANSLENALTLARISAGVTHDHPEGIKGAQAVAAAVFLAKSGKTKGDIKKYIEKNFYSLNKTLEEIRPNYFFDETCQGTVPQAIRAFLESAGFEDSIRNAVSLGGDSDTLAAITGSISYAFYNRSETGRKKNKKLTEKAKTFLPGEFIVLCADFEKFARETQNI